MSKFGFNKLIRSKLIEKMEQAGIKVVKKYLSTEEYYEALKEKSLEEISEIINSKDNIELTEEIADLLQVLDAICELKNIDKDDLLHVKNEKNIQKGDFSERIKVSYVEFDDSDDRFKTYLDYYLNDPDKYPKIH